MNVLVTGAAGFAGRYVVQDLLAHGHTVRALDLRPGEAKGVEWQVADLTNLAAMEAAVDGMDAVIHLAAIPTPRPRPDWPLIMQVNVLGTYNVMEAMVRRGVQRIAFASSACVLGGVCNLKHRPRPPYLPYDEELTEDGDEPYTLSKVVNEKTGRMFALNGLIETVISLRFWNLRPVEEHGLAAMHCPVLWVAVHPEDIAQGCRKAVEVELTGFHAFALGSRYRYTPEGERETPEQILAELKEAGLERIERRYGYPYEWQSSGSSHKAIAMLGYDPRY